MEFSVMLIITMVLNRDTLTREEPMPNLAACWSRANEEMLKAMEKYPEMGFSCKALAISDFDTVVPA